MELRWYQRLRFGADEGTVLEKEHYMLESTKPIIPIYIPPKSLIPASGYTGNGKKVTFYRIETHNSDIYALTDGHLEEPDKGDYVRFIKHNFGEDRYLIQGAREDSVRDYERIKHIEKVAR